MKRLLIVLTSILLYTGLQAQASLSVSGSSFPGLADSVFMNQGVSYLVYTKNVGNVDFFGPYTIHVGVDTGGFLVTPFYSQNYQTTDTLYSQVSVDTQAISHSIDYNYFSAGGNTIVIWPAAPNAITHDSIARPIYVIVFDAIDEQGMAMELNIYPNPGSEWVRINSKYGIEQVRILSAGGQEIQCIQNQSEIDISVLPKGMYLFVITDKMKHTKTLCVVRN
ncbi:MAG: T9SS type A sorting domain-containing protein [Flavobacteriales bacterium]|nr:T9SS type A sorting domain-containing protein [Flavobacteriales bacterium]